MRRIFLFALGLVALLSLGAARPEHDHHLSIAEMRFWPQDKVMQITLRTFADDLERAIELDTGEDLRLGSPKEHPDAHKLIIDYLRKKLEIEADGEAMYYGLWQIEQDFEDLKLELVAPLKEIPHEIWVRHEFLLEVYDDQQNWINIFFGEGVQTMRFRRGLSQEALQL